MLLTRSLPPQFLLPAWSSVQLAQAANIAQRAGYSTDNSTESSLDSNCDSATDATPRSDGASLSIKRPLSTPARRIARKAGGGPSAYGNDLRSRKDIGSRHGYSRQSQRAPGEVAEAHAALSSREAARRLQFASRGYPKPNVQEPVKQANGDQLANTLDPLTSGERSNKQATTLEPITYTGKPLPGSQQAACKDDLEEEPLSLFEELFPEEALAREKREKRALENLEKLPAFNWTPEFRRGVEYEKAQARERERETRKAALHAIPAQPVANDRKFSIDSQYKGIQPETKKGDLSGSRRYAVLVIGSCSTSLEESDFYRVTAKGQHVEDWTRGIVKVIPARDNMTLAPLGKYFLVFSSNAAARAYLERTLDLKEFATANDFTRYHRARRMGEEPGMMIQNFSLVPSDGQLSIQMLAPPFSKGVQWMIDAGGPAPLVGRQNKAQDIVLFTTDGRGGYIEKRTLARALADDGLRRNLHWRFAGDRDEAIVKLETNLLDETASGRRKTTYKGPARYTIAFKDSNEARRFVREWHRRPFPLTSLRRLKEEAGDEPLPVVHAEICW